MKNNVIIGIAISILLLLLCAFLFSVKDALTPFILAFIIAYITNPAVRFLQKIGCAKIIAVSIIVSSLIILAIVLVMLIIPLAYYQSINFIQKIPEYINDINATYQTYIPQINKYIPKEEVDKLGADISSRILGLSSKLISGIWSSGLAIASIVFFTFLTPIILFYTSYQWDNMLERMKKLIPLQYYETTMKEVQNIDDTISGYIRGQTMVCMVAATYYIIAFTSLKLNYAVFIGLISGLLTFIPYAGSTFCFVSIHLIAFSQFENLLDIAKITIAFTLEQIIEIAFLIPYLVGDKIQLHPLWVIFSIIAGGVLFGFVGVLIALPMAAIIGVLTRFAIKKYLTSDFYAGRTITTDQ